MRFEASLDKRYAVVSPETPALAVWQLAFNAHEQMNGRDTIPQNHNVISSHAWTVFWMNILEIYKICYGEKEDLSQAIEEVVSC